MRRELIETFEFQAELKKDAKDIWKAVVQRADIVNANRRVYPYEVLKKAVEEFKKLVEAGRAVGTLEHPEDGRTRVYEISHKIEDIWMEEDGTVYAYIRPLNTINGQQLRALLEAGVKVGLSTRGVGSTRPATVEGKEVEIVEDDYELLAIDVVYSPSVPSAYIVESREDIDMDMEKFLSESVRAIRTYYYRKLIEERRFYHRLIGDLLKEFSTLADRKKLIALEGILQIVKPLMGKNPKVVVEATQNGVREKEMEDLKLMLNKLRLENYKLKKALEEGVEYEYLRDAESEREVDRLVKLYKEKVKRSVKVEAVKEGEDASLKWAQKFQSFSFRR